MDREQVQNAQRILEWRKSIEKMPDNQFFELMRMYIGEVKTPFNKHKLIEELSVFLRKIENKEKIAKLLSESDMSVIAAVKFISNATTKKVTTFFGGTFTFSKLYERIINLEERLILYRHEEDGKEYLRVNPHLDEVFDKIITKSILVKKANVINENKSQYFRLSPELLAAFASFVGGNPSLCKADGTFKKKTASLLEEMFGDNSGPLFLVKQAFENLSILVEDENGKSSIDKSKFISFSRLPETVQHAYIAVASQGRFSRGSLTQQAKLLIETILSIPESGYTRENLLRSAFIKSGKKKDNTGESAFGARGRFASILQRAKEREAEDADESRKTATEDNDTIFSTMDRLLDSAQELGLLRIKGIEKGGIDVLEAGEGLREGLFQNFSGAEERKVLNIDAAYNVLLFPGLPLESLIPLTEILDLKKFDTAVSFELTKKSIMRGFDSGMDEKSVVSTLQAHCVHDLPQNLLVSIDDWKKSYSSVAVYKGYILKVASDNPALSEKNPNFAKHIVETLAPGIFLLDVSTDEEAKRILESSGKDFAAKIRSAEPKKASEDFPILRIDDAENGDGGDGSGFLVPTSDDERKAHFDKLRGALSSMKEREELTQEEYECLLFRVNRKIVLDESQLKKESVKFAKLEATGMDFPGKVHIIEQAVADRSTIEITFMSSENPEGVLATGIPVSTEKSDDDVTVTMKMTGTSVMKTFSISQASKVRRVYSSAFS